VRFLAQHASAAADISGGGVLLKRIYEQDQITKYDISETAQMETVFRRIVRPYAPGIVQVVVDFRDRK